MRVDGATGFLGLLILLAIVFVAYHAGKRGMLG